MADDSGIQTGRGAGVAEPKGARCLVVGGDGIRNSRDFANYMSALMSDLAEGRITPGVGNAICNAGGKLLKVKEMELRYGTVGNGGQEKTLALSDGARE